MPYYIDTETCGLHGMPVLLQYAKDDGEIILHNLWKTSLEESLALIEDIATDGVIGFNLAFDWFQLFKFWTTGKRYLELNPYNGDIWPEDIIDELAVCEKEARDYPYCLKPSTVLDLMLHARKGPYQSLMDRDDIRIRRIPRDIAPYIVKELETRIVFKDVYFARLKDKSADRWRIVDIKDEDGETEADFVDIVLTFHPSSALKALAMDALNLKEDSILKFVDIEVDPQFRPNEFGFAPYALAGVYEKDHLMRVGPNNWRGTWPAVIKHHITHWTYNEYARTYAKNDIVYTRDLYKFFGRPAMDDVDSILSCMVAVCRWRGYRVDCDGLKTLRDEALIESKAVPTAPEYVRRYLEDAMSPTEKVFIRTSTKKVILEEVATWRNDDDTPHPAALKAQAVLEARQAAKRVDLYDKLLIADRFHASFVVIGTLSTRMAGADGLNPQGINKNANTRSKFPLAHKDMVLCGGDFSAFEVTLAEAVFQDAELRAELLKGKKIHALFGAQVFPNETYESIKASDGTNRDLYKISKSGFFALIYGGTEYTLQTRLGISAEDAAAGYQNFIKKYPGIARARQKVYDMFCSMRQPAGIGTKVEWHEPSDYIESFLGFRRYFTLENMIARTLFQIGEKPPDSWKGFKQKVVRRERQQTMSGAAQSACFGAAFGIQAANMRAANNHLIQSPGAQITKELQSKIWEIQPSGVALWQVQPMNIHDEIMCPLKQEHAERVQTLVAAFIEGKRPLVPLIKMDWKNFLTDWASK